MRTVESAIVVRFVHKQNKGKREEGEEKGRKIFGLLTFPPVPGLFHRPRFFLDRRFWASGNATTTHSCHRSLSLFISLSFYFKTVSVPTTKYTYELDDSYYL